MRGTENVKSGRADEEAKRNESRGDGAMGRDIKAGCSGRDITIGITRAEK
jgi:hypothetical protein